MNQLGIREALTSSVNDYIKKVDIEERRKAAQLSAAPECIYDVLRRKFLDESPQKIVENNGLVKVSISAKNLGYSLEDYSFELDGETISFRSYPLHHAFYKEVMEKVMQLAEAEGISCEGGSYEDSEYWTYTCWTFSLKIDLPERSN